jgi:hypothetical protein
VVVLNNYVREAGQEFEQEIDISVIRYSISPGTLQVSEDTISYVLERKTGGKFAGFVAVYHKDNGEVFVYKDYEGNEFGEFERISIDVSNDEYVFVEIYSTIIVGGKVLISNYPVESAKLEVKEEEVVVESSFECSDGKDNDGDGKIDHPNDPGCDSINDDDESDDIVVLETECSDGKDNDGDGKIDYDGDGNTDLVDSDCVNSDDNYESSPLAFPGAEGFGAMAKGGRGGSIVYVNNLGDYDLSVGESVIPGTLRWALEENTGKRTILFKIGGNIKLKKRIVLNGEEDSYVTIAGQSAPGDGVMLENFGISVSGMAHDIVIRYMKIRVGYPKKQACLDDHTINECWDNDAIDIYGTPTDLIFDHNSLSWAIDENTGNSGGGERITFQYNIIAEGSKFGHADSNKFATVQYPYYHSMGLLANSNVNSDEYLSLHHNIIMSSRDRNPLLVNNGGVVDFINNIIYNWGAIGTQITTGTSEGAISPRVNIIKNLYYRGPGFEKPIERRPIRLVTVADSAIYISGNLGKSVFSNDQLDSTSSASNHWTDDWDFVSDSSQVNRAPVSKRALTRFNTPGISVTEDNANSLVDSFKTHIGASIPKRDSVDIRLFQELESGTGKIGYGELGLASDIVEKINIDPDFAIYKHPVLNQGTSIVDSDNDGMPDIWEDTNGFDKNDVSDGNEDEDMDGYTNVEEYLNSLAYFRLFYITYILKMSESVV